MLAIFFYCLHNHSDLTSNRFTQYDTIQRKHKHIYFYFSCSKLRRIWILQKSSRKYNYYRSPTWVIGDPSTIEMTHWRHIGDWHTSLETHLRPISLIGHRHAIGHDLSSMSVFNGTTIRHICIRSGMLVSGETKR